MLFNSIDFAIFLPFVFLIYWSLQNKNLKIQNLFLVCASYFFYAMWDWRFLILIVLSTIIDFYVGRFIGNNGEKKKLRKLLLLVSIIVNLGLLGYFKYFNFFIESFAATFSFFGWNIVPARLNIILPVGISFYTFQTLSYTIDVYRGKVDATEDHVAFAAFVSFFPQLVAGPIEKANVLLPQMLEKRSFNSDAAKYGLLLMTYGLFKKVVIADNLAPVVDAFYSPVSFEILNLSHLIWAVFGYSLQIYCDFSGYSDIAIGTALLFGVRLSQNFRRPYFSSGSQQFWRRWHISLSSWFRDYVFIPLGGSRSRETRVIFNIFVVFVVSGLWHGANWTFVLWGVGHFVYYLICKYSRINSALFGKLNILFTFIVVSLLWVPFRSTSVDQFMSIVGSFSTSGFLELPFGKFVQAKLFFLIIILFFYEIYHEKIVVVNRYTELNLVVLSTIIITMGSFGNNSFVYFQF